MTAMLPMISTQQRNLQVVQRESPGVPAKDPSSLRLNLFHVP